MRIVTNPGSNLPDELVRSLGIVLAPQKISVDGVEHDTRLGVTLSQVDDWVRTAKAYPFVLGSSAAEMVAVFREILATDNEIVAVMTSRHVIGTYTAAMSASRVLKDRGLDARVVDSRCTDLGAGLPTLLAAQAARAGMPIGEVVALVESFCAGVTFALVPDTLEWLVKAGKATALKAFFANWLSLRPLIEFAEGELRSAGSVKRGDEPVIAALVEHAVKKIGAGRPVWAAVMHGSVPDKAMRLEAELRTRFDVRYCLNRPLHASIYHSAGPGTLALYVAPVDRLPATIAPPR